MPEKYNKKKKSTKKNIKIENTEKVKIKNYEKRKIYKSFRRIKTDILIFFSF